MIRVVEGAPWPADCGWDAPPGPVTVTLEARATILELAMWATGLDASTHAVALAHLCGPGAWDLERPFRVRGERTEGVSTCGVVAEGLWRLAGVDCPELLRAYVPGTAIARAIRFARAHGAWASPTMWADLRPEPGDYVVIGSGMGTHALTCVGWDDDELLSVDGGQTDEHGLQAVRERRRTWRPRDGVPLLDDRRVIGWAIADLLPYRLP